MGKIDKDFLQNNVAMANNFLRWFLITPSTLELVMAVTLVNFYRKNYLKSQGFIKSVPTNIINLSIIDGRKS